MAAIPEDQKLIPLRAAVQNYAWGLPSSANSLVARLHSLNSGEAVSTVKPYAELWIGTHPNGPAELISSTPMSLSEFLSKNDLPDIPYLLKVLSVAKPLSIQAHPDKTLAAELHARNPSAYKDDNHKPEMCVALSQFEGMCNFRPIEEIKAHLEALPDMAQLCDAESVNSILSTSTDAISRKKAIRHLFSTLMTASADSVQETLVSIEEDRKSRKVQTDADRLFLRLVQYYPGDVGCFAAYLLNYVQIQPGQAFFMAANEPHAYLAGQCVEIMARSDNVVRAGLTPKFKDVSTLVDMLTYQDAYPTIMNGDALDEFSMLYEPPVEEFQLIKSVIPTGKKQVLPGLKGASIILCMDGHGWIAVTRKSVEKEKHVKYALSAGRIYYVADGISVQVEACDSAVSGAASPELVLFRASINQKQI
ncbi:Mannose-6-phosphate isomerase 1 [Gracilariopsis chorda]|uniref:Mannose-6-phosphate isomerase n=2 Tax=Gracilariopsis TaxID=2781 RepID=A0A2V3J5U5_9FLOR|nr:mannose-6-phosphate isomerase [Gracilariopsis lemaneiformis]PXF48760.1 Mannose-6-phosphate isomerase 1 [Gracilariopsis chorda]|eukprot:PXF48760.1 Mannose-6-phosphate isomerase 1 [Gracilariopsis chorda]